jgi:putative GTP pyrophosphokinase
MTDPKNEGTPRVDVEQILTEFDGKKDSLQTCCERTKDLIAEFLQDGKIRYQSLQCRVKSRDKLKGKYLDTRKNYKQLDDITDLIALRIVTYYEDEVDRVAEVVKREFDVDPQRSVDKRETEPDKFGYYALNFVCKYPKRRTCQTEYKKFDGVWFEVQITSILRHAWSEIEHPWYDLKEAFPAHIKRRFARMAALLEIAESEFLALKNLQSDYKRAVAVQVEAQVPDIPVDSVSLRTFIETDSNLEKLDRALASKMRFELTNELADVVVESLSRAANAAGIKSLQQLRDSLRGYADAIPEYALRGDREAWPDRPPNLVVTRGTSIFYLLQMLANLQGIEATIEYLSAAGLTPVWKVESQVATAKQVVEEIIRE